jgi:hypothetical protein
MTAIFAFTGSAVLAQNRPAARAPDRPASGRSASGQDNQKLSQNRKHQDHIKLDDHDRQVIGDWYKPDRDNVLVGLRDPNGVAPYVDPRLRIGSAQDVNLPIRRSATIEFLYRLTSSPRSYQYVAIQGHVEAIDDNFQDMNDLIHLKLFF